MDHSERILRCLGLYVVAEQQDSSAGAAGQLSNPIFDPLAHLVVGVAIVELPRSLARTPAASIAAVEADAEEVRTGDGVPDRENGRRRRAVDGYQCHLPTLQFVKDPIVGPGTVAKFNGQGQPSEHIEQGRQVATMSRRAVERRWKLDQNGRQLPGLNQRCEAVPVVLCQARPTLSVDFMCQGARQPDRKKECRRDLTAAAFERLGPGQLISRGVDLGHGEMAGIQRQHPAGRGAGRVEPGGNPFGVGIAAGADMDTARGLGWLGFHTVRPRCALTPMLFARAES